MMLQNPEPDIEVRAISINGDRSGSYTAVVNIRVGQIDIYSCYFTKENEWIELRLPNVGWAREWDNPVVEVTEELRQQMKQAILNFLNPY